MPTTKSAPGDDLLRFAQREGVSLQAIRGRPENGAIFARRDVHVVHLEDELFVPEREHNKTPRLTSGNTHCVVYNPRKRTLHLVLRDEAGAPSQVDYTLSHFVYDGPIPPRDWPFPDKLYGFAHEGIVHAELPAAIVQLKLTLEDAPDDPLEVRLGRHATSGLLDIRAGTPRHRDGTHRRSRRAPRLRS